MFSKSIAVVIAALAAVVFIGTLVHALWYAPDSEIQVPDQKQIVAATSSLPVRLQIPKLSIDADVQRVGIGKKGNMAVPTNYSDVGWYRYGTVPGQLGSAVVDGHIDNGFGLPAVFKRLTEINVGDDIYVVAEDGSRLHFKVTDKQIYPYANAPLDYIFNRSDKARLNLITCEGTWLKSEKMYDKRLVIFSELVS